MVVKVLEDRIDSEEIIFDGFTIVRHRDFLDLNVSNFVGANLRKVDNDGRQSVTSNPEKVLVNTETTIHRIEDVVHWCESVSNSFVVDALQSFLE